MSTVNYLTVTSSQLCLKIKMVDAELWKHWKSTNIRHNLQTHSNSTQERTLGRLPAIALLRYEKLEFFERTLNLISKSYEPSKFVTQISKQSPFLWLKNTFFSKFCPRYAQIFKFTPVSEKILGCIYDLVTARNMNNLIIFSNIFPTFLYNQKYRGEGRSVRKLI